MYKEAASLYNKENAAEANHAQDKTLLKAQLPEESEGDNKNEEKSTQKLTRNSYFRDWVKESAISWQANLCIKL